MGFGSPFEPRARPDYDARRKVQERREAMLNTAQTVADHFPEWLGRRLLLLCLVRDRDGEVVQPRMFKKVRFAVRDINDEDLTEILHNVSFKRPEPYHHAAYVALVEREVLNWSPASEEALFKHIAEAFDKPNPIDDALRKKREQERFERAAEEERRQREEAERKKRFEKEMAERKVQLEKEMAEKARADEERELAEIGAMMERSQDQRFGVF